ncbi:septum site-determining protein MinC [Vibrio sp.]|uniref:Probable septum site-determining protein MinC n=1 Tax=Vibrio viridaestus TaxID=2487322 RepID=A0A3N9THD2_9VIBR|nr:septum site-determining protein MinC [Vibrio viridaestus]MDC0611554.1 septum site-determining protein MinC [Vibrio sp.]RQW63718.1 septum site-determining protein MinC [Vibrio viridaestus]
MSNTPDLKGSSFTLSVLHLPDGDINSSIEFLKEKVEQAPAFFANAPVVINIAQVKRDIDFAELKNGISKSGMVPVGITGTKDKRTQTLASEAGFAVMTASKSPQQAPQQMTPTKVVTTPIRSGQQIYAKDCDLVVMNNVSAGAEVIADGSIHIYGSLRGRAIAGASGLQEARIYCHDLQAELVSIAGNYWLSDQITSEYWQKKVMLSLAGETLHFEIFTA